MRLVAMLARVTPVAEPTSNLQLSYFLYPSPSCAGGLSSSLPSSPSRSRQELRGFYIMAVAPEVIAMYNQHDFVPSEMYTSWAAHGNTIGSILEWLMLPTDVGNAVLSEVGVHAGDHVSVVAYVTPNEWETMIAPAALQGAPQYRDAQQDPPGVAGGSPCRGSGSSSR